MLTETVCMALSAAGLAIALITAWRRHYKAAVRWAGLALLPAGLYLTGLITVFRKIGTAIGTWAAHLVFDPKVWVGVVLLGVAVLLLLMTGVRPKRGRKPVRTGSSAAPVPARTAPAVAAKKGDTDDMKEIEELLKRRGI